MIPRQLRLRRWYRGAIPPGRSSPLEIVMIQATPFCNINCSYCYLPNRNDKRRLDLGLLEPLFTKLDDAGLLGEEVSVVWHAGEPLVLSPDFYRAAFAEIARLVGPGTRIVHHVQTNGLLLTQAFCDLFKEAGVQVSLSVDGPAFLHDRVRVTRSGQGTHAAAVKAAELLRANGIGFPVIAVLTAESLAHPDAIYDFLLEIGAQTFGFNIDEMEGHNRESSFGGEAEAAYGRFLQRILELCDRDERLPLFREFRGAFSPGAVVERETSRGASESNPFSILSMDVSGGLYTFSPELVDLKDAAGGDYSIGHVGDIDFLTVLESPRFQAIHQPIVRGIERCRQECAYFAGCGGGAPVNKLSENGAFDTTETTFCRFTRQLTRDAVDEFAARKLDRLRAARREARAARPAASGKETHAA